MKSLQIAEHLLRNVQLKKEMNLLINGYEEYIKDIIVIFVTEDWECDVYWNKLEKSDLKISLKAVIKGLSTAEEMPNVEEFNDSERTCKMPELIVEKAPLSQARRTLCERCGKDSMVVVGPLVIPLRVRILFFSLTIDVKLVVKYCPSCGFLRVDVDRN